MPPNTKVELYPVKLSIANRNPLRDLTAENVASGTISGILAMTGSVILILEAAAAGNFTAQQTVSWLFAAYFFGGIFSILFPLIYKLPITGGHSISAAAFLVTVTSHFTFPQLIGGYVMSGLLIVIVGITGLFNKLMEWFSREVIAAMLGGMVVNYVVRVVPAIGDLPIAGFSGLLGFLLFMKFIKRIPPVIGAIVFGLAALWITGSLSKPSESLSYFLPTVYTPEFTIIGLISLAFPMALLILSNDCAQGIGAMQGFNFRPPIKPLITFSGFTSVLSGLFGGHCSNVAGMMTAICAGDESGPRHKRYMASVVSGALTLLFGLFAWFLVGYIQALPKALILIIAGFALIGVLLSSLQIAFSNPKYRFSTLFAFIIALSNVSLFTISAPVWALIVGAMMAKINKEGQ